VTEITYAYPTATSWTRERCRDTVESYRRDFVSDDCLHEEQEEIVLALGDSSWPSSWSDYERFCLVVLGHVPRTADA
jgi:hypothetical protein